MSSWPAIREAHVLAPILWISWWPIAAASALDMLPAPFDVGISYNPFRLADD